MSNSLGDSLRQHLTGQENILSYQFLESERFLSVFWNSLSKCKQFQYPGFYHPITILSVVASAGISGNELGGGCPVADGEGQNLEEVRGG